MFIGFLSKLARGQGKKILRLYKIRRTRSDSVSVSHSFDSSPYIILISVENFDKFFTISRFAVEDDRGVKSFGGRNKSIGESLSYSGKDIEKYQLRFPGKNDST